MLSLSHNILSFAWLILLLKISFEFCSWAMDFSIPSSFQLECSSMFLSPIEFSSQVLHCPSHFHQPYRCVFVDIVQVFILLKLFFSLILWAALLNLLQILNSLTRHIIVLLQSMSWGSSRQLSLANTSRVLVSLGKKILGLYLILLLFLSWGLGMWTYLLNFSSGLSWADWSRRENIVWVVPRG